MASVYHVRMMDGAMFEVVTDRHHAGSVEAEFHRHLAEVISTVEARPSAVLGFVHRGPAAASARRLIVFGEDLPDRR